MCNRSQHRTCDLVLASMITVATFNVAYRASVVLGTVLLQTAPPRRLSGGRMEAFLRAMREVNRSFVFVFYLAHLLSPTRSNDIHKSCTSLRHISGNWHRHRRLRLTRWRELVLGRWWWRWSCMWGKMWGMTTCWRWPGGHGRDVLDRWGVIRGRRLEMGWVLKLLLAWCGGNFVVGGGGSVENVNLFFCFCFCLLSYSLKGYSRSCLIVIDTTVARK
jgi:hypothetical protein